jgi:hypothetical protein
MQVSYMVGDLIKVCGRILSIQFSKYPAPQGSMAFDIGTEPIEFEGKVVRTSEDGQIVSFQVTKPINTDNSTSPVSIDVGSIINLDSLEDLHVEHLNA